MALAKRAFELASPPLIGVVLAWFLHALPHGVMEFLMAWTLLSLPIGVVIGHLALSED